MADEPSPAKTNYDQQEVRERIAREIAVRQKDWRYECSGILEPWFYSYADAAMQVVGPVLDRLEMRAAEKAAMCQMDGCQYFDVEGLHCNVARLEAELARLQSIIKSAYEILRHPDHAEVYTIDDLNRDWDRLRHLIYPEALKLKESGNA